MYSSRHNHALRRSREGSGRFVGGPVDNRSEDSPLESSLSHTYHSDPGNSIVAGSTPTNNYLPFSNQMESLQEPLGPSSDTNTNNNNHTPNEELKLIRPSGSGNEASVSSSEQRGTVITNIAAS